MDIIFFADIFYSKVVDNQQEKDVFGGVITMGGGTRNRGVP